MSFYHTTLRLLEKNKDRHFAQQDWGLYRNSIFHMSEVQKNIDINESLSLLVDVCLLDLSGLGNSNMFAPKLIFLAPGIVSRLKDLVDQVGFSIQEFQELIKERFNSLAISTHFIGVSESIEVITLSIENFEKSEERIKTLVNSKSEKKTINKTSRKKGSLLSRLFNR